MTTTESSQGTGTANPLTPGGRAWMRVEQAGIDMISGREAGERRPPFPLDVLAALWALGRAGVRWLWRHVRGDRGAR